MHGGAPSVHFSLSSVILSWQHFAAPPGRFSQPTPPHEPHPASQHTRLSDDDRIPESQFGSGWIMHGGPRLVHGSLFSMIVSWQHFAGPPGRLPQPSPPHDPHPASQHTRFADKLPDGDPEDGLLNVGDGLGASLSPVVVGDPVESPGDVGAGNPPKSSSSGDVGSLVSKRRRIESVEDRTPKSQFGSGVPSLGVFEISSGPHSRSLMAAAAYAAAAAASSASTPSSSMLAPKTCGHIRWRAVTLGLLPKQSSKLSRRRRRLPGVWSPKTLRSVQSFGTRFTSTHAPHADHASHRHMVGDTEGFIVGEAEGDQLGLWLGLALGEMDGDRLGLTEGALEGHPISST